ncbi:hypothetical protein [Inquilinus sp. CA228]|uniref:hypothetical protein n=1 Tax=Inquilinus sp. CA228 TaxID=3455609 RepID=UPI003F8D3350
MVEVSRLKRDRNDLFLFVFDREQWCPVFLIRLETPDLDRLRSLLGSAADNDPELNHGYRLDEDEAAAIAAASGTELELSGLDTADREYVLHWLHSIDTAPYLVHTGYELPLLLDGRKKLARMVHEYPPMTFDGEHRFDHWVAQGVLHREEIVEPFGRPMGEFLGFRTVYYTPKGEEWRIPALKLIVEASARPRGWNEDFERLEGMIFGYEDWQNDWWIDTGIQGGGFGGVVLCCSVDAAGLAWMEAAGFRALPPAAGPVLTIFPYDPVAVEKMLADAGGAALVSFVVPGIAVLNLSGPLDGSPWRLAADRVPELNKHLRRAVVVRARRG